MAAFSPSQAIQFGWANAKTHWRWWIPVIILYFIVVSIPGMFSPEEGESSNAYSLISFIFWIAQMWLTTGIALAAWQTVKGQTPKYAMLMPPVISVLRFTLASLVTAIVPMLVGFTFVGLSSALVIVNVGQRVSPTSIVLLAIIALVVLVALVWFTLRLSLAPYAAVIEHVWPIHAIRRSWSLTRGNVGGLLWFALLSMGVMIIGFLCLFIGLLWAMPTIFVAYLYVYRQLAEGSSV